MQNQNLKSQFLSTLFDRGFIHDCTDLHGLDLVLINNDVRGKLGDFGEVVDSLIINSNFNN